jgi:hypothetical protein
LVIILPRGKQLRLRRVSCVFGDMASLDAVQIELGVFERCREYHGAREEVGRVEQCSRERNFGRNADASSKLSEVAVFPVQWHFEARYDALVL